MSFENRHIISWPDDPQAAISHIARHITRDPGARQSYEFLSDAFYWSDEIEPHSFSGTMGVLMLIAHRQRIIDGVASDLTEWWNHAKSHCPQWIGFLPERQQLDAQQREQLTAARRNAAEQWKRHLGPPPK